MQEWDSYGLDPIQGIAFLKDTLPLTDHEQAIYDIATTSLDRQRNLSTLWHPDFEKSALCFEQVCPPSLPRIPSLLLTPSYILPHRLRCHH